MLLVWNRINIKFEHSKLEFLVRAIYRGMWCGPMWIATFDRNIHVLFYILPSKTNGRQKNTLVHSHAHYSKTSSGWYGHKWTASKFCDRDKWQYGRNNKSFWLPHILKSLTRIHSNTKICKCKSNLSTKTINNSAMALEFRIKSHHHFHILSCTIKPTERRRKKKQHT